MFSLNGTSASSLATQDNGLCDELSERIYQTNERLRNIESRLRFLADRLFSERPEVDRELEEFPPGTVNLLAWGISEANHLIDGAVSQLERLEQL